MPTYNRASLIEDALDSVKTQNYRPIEIVIVDDGSTDDTEVVVNAWKDRNADEVLSVNYIKKANAGATVARNLGIKVSKGDLIHFLDSDDLFLPYCIEDKCKSLIASKADYVYGFSTITDMTGNNIGKHGVDVTNNLNQAYIIPYTFNTSGPLVKKETLNKIGGWNESLNGCQEIELFFRLKKDIGRGVCLPKFLHQVRLHNEGSISQNPSKKHADSAFKVLQIMVAAMPELAQKLNTIQFKNESEALSSFAIDVSIKNFNAENVAKSLKALTISKLYTYKTSKKIVFSSIQFLALFSKSLALRLLKTLRGN
ncbi:glycosyltransferase family 2 protein [Winogradskyella sediminis]|nr:glycosyltransferase family A protein [Winogradskyella sediminis]